MTPSFSRHHQMTSPCLRKARSFLPVLIRRPVTAVVADSRDNEVLMLAFMNAQALRLTIDTGIAHYWSRSRSALWKKGETSGNLQMVDEIRLDCDQDAVLLKVRVSGADATCHTGRRSCFYRKVIKTDGETRLETDSAPLFDPGSVYTDH
jgi:phosphoribosyl-AMP cyclohydrolase